MPGAVAAAQASGRVETIWIPMVETPAGGPASELRLEATLYRPSPTGSHPVVIFNHGSTGAGRQSPGVTVQYPETARFFVERGMAVLIPMRRGRGKSGGAYLERYDCDSSVFRAGVERAIADLDAVMEFVAKQPWADTTRLVLGGMSRGGFLSIVYSSIRRTGARGVINFAGGWTVERCETRIGFHDWMLGRRARPRRCRCSGSTRRTTGTTVPSPSAPITARSPRPGGPRSSISSRRSVTTGISSCRRTSRSGAPPWTTS